MSIELSPAEREWFTLQLRLRFHERTAQGFQDLFADLMERAHADDFVRVRAHGPTGDLKCDGYLRESGTVFQVYAPQGLELATLQRKISDDLCGAREHWGPRMHAWVFVHNQPQGLPAQVVQQFDDLQQQHALPIQHWSLEQLRQLTERMTRAQLIDLLGRPPRPEDFHVLRFPDIAPVLRALEQKISTARPAELGQILPVSAAKLEANALGRGVAMLLRLGRETERLVEAYFERHHDPTFGERVAVGYRREYQRLRGEGWSPDDIFAGLVEFSGGAPLAGNATAALYTVLAYFFERCDIYEAPTPADAPPDQTPA